MNIEQQRSNFQRAYVKTDYYKIHYEKTNTSNSAFSWNNETNRYTWHDVNSAWEMWLEAQRQEGYVMVPVEPIDEIDLMICKMVDHRIDCFEADRIYKTIIEEYQK